MDEQQKQLIAAGQKIIERAEQGDEQAVQIKDIAEQAMSDEARQQEIMAMAQSNDPEKQQLGMLVIGTAMALQQEQTTPNNAVSYAKNGAKINYLKKLRGQCPDGYETAYFEQGGSLVKGCKKCAQKKLAKAQEGKKMSAVEEFKCGGKKKVAKGEKGFETKRVGSQKSNTDDGYEIERTYSDGSKEQITYDSKNNPIGARGRRGDFYNRYTNKSKMDISRIGML